ncbi:hypothetical protein PHISCL_07392 [Aspergillus sclerotialis]|uniref:Uncharacterized protein n=1 Tax=Aspergillus sclerotialis TaxID=2070753 RepID=A0A3A2ZAU0_9EURO|nr:hypothetical protein PHISCL_07392 [Aspergillus sclerotialis]
MSAQRSGRQSPPPESQSGAQQQEVPSMGKIAPEYMPDPEKSQRESEDTKLTRLESNPKHPLEDIEQEKSR